MHRLQQHCIARAERRVQAGLHDAALRPGVAGALRPGVAHLLRSQLLESRCLQQLPLLLPTRGANEAASREQPLWEGGSSLWRAVEPCAIDERETAKAAAHGGAASGRIWSGRAGSGRAWSGLFVGGLLVRSIERLL